MDFLASFYVRVETGCLPETTRALRWTDLQVFFASFKLAEQASGGHV